MPHPGHFAPAGPLRALGYRLLWTCSNTLQKGANACLYLAAGLLRRDDLRAASRVRWREFGTAVDDVDAGLGLWERRLYGDLLRPSDRVLLVGCGTGRDLLALRDLGHDVTGLEQAPELVELARQHLTRRGMTAPVHTGYIETWDLDSTYDVILFSNACYSYLHPSAMRVATLARIKSHVAEEGRIVLNYMSFVRQSPFAHALMRISARLAQADWRPEPGDTFSRDHLRQRILRCEHMFRPGEVARECASAGLRVIRDEVTMSPFCCAVAVP